MAFFFLATGLLWHFLGYAQISTVTLSSQFSTNPATFSFCTKDTCQTKAENLEIPISFTVYMIAIASFVGWLLFTLFGGVGLAALPLDLILGFLNRPRPISNAQYLEMKKLIGEQAAGLLQSNEKLLVERKSLVHAKFWKDRKYRRIYRKEKEFKRVRTRISLIIHHLNLCIYLSGCFILGLAISKIRRFLQEFGRKPDNSLHQINCWISRVRLPML